MIKEEDILESLDDVDPDKIVDYLANSNEVGMLLHAIANQNSKIVIDSYVSILEAIADAKRYNLAADIAYEKELRGEV